MCGERYWFEPLKSREPAGVFTVDRVHPFADLHIQRWQVLYGLHPQGCDPCTGEFSFFDCF